MTHRSPRALVLFALVALFAACGGKIDVETSPVPDAGTHPSPAPTSTSTSSPPSPPASPPDAGARPPTFPDASTQPEPVDAALPLDYPLAVDDCASRPWSTYGSGAADSIVDGWMRAKVAKCQVPGAPVCGKLTVHFSRMPEPGCADDLIFSEAPPPAFIDCIRDLLAQDRLTAGNFVNADTETLSMCP